MFIVLTVLKLEPFAASSGNKVKGVKEYGEKGRGGEWDPVVVPALLSSLPSVLISSSLNYS